MIRIVRWFAYRLAAYVCVATLSAVALCAWASTLALLASPCLAQERTGHEPRLTMAQYVRILTCDPRSHGEAACEAERTRILRGVTR